MANCLDNIVSIKGSCSPTTPTSGLYLDDIDIPMHEVEQYVGKEYKDAEALVQAKIKFAAKQVAAEVNQHFKSSYMMASILEGARVGFEQENMVAVAQDDAKFAGIFMEMTTDDSFVDFYISEISLFTDYTGDVTVTVYDAFQNKALDTITVACVANQISTAYVGKAYRSSGRNMKIAFLYDTTGIDSYKTLLVPNSCSTCSRTGNLTALNSYALARAVTAANNVAVISSNLDTASDTGGMSIVYSLNCNHYDWICRVGNVLAMPLLYRAGAEIMHYALQQGTRQNSRTMLDVEKIQLKAQRLEDLYKETMADILPKMKLPSDSRCFQCDEKVKWRSVMP